MNMAGPFLILWVVLFLPIALLPIWLHPDLRTKKSRREYRWWIAGFLVGTWALTTGADMLNPALSLLTTLGTLSFLTALFGRSVWLLRKRIRADHASEAEFDRAVRAIYEDQERGL